MDSICTKRALHRAQERLKTWCHIRWGLLRELSVESDAVHGQHRLDAGRTGGSIGTLLRSSVRAPGDVEVDFGIARKFRVKESATFQMRGKPSTG